MVYSDISKSWTRKDGTFIFGEGERDHQHLIRICTWRGAEVRNWLGMMGPGGWMDGPAAVGGDADGVGFAD